MWRRIRGLLGTIIPIAIAILCVGIVIVTFVVVYNDRRELIKTNQALIEQVKSTGQVPVVDSPNEVVRGDAGSPGETGPRGAQGEAGRPPTSAEILAAIRSYCADGKCMGERGQVGASGAPGADSTIPGPSGASGKDSTVPGPQGSSGATGPAGADSQVPGPAGPMGAAGADSTVPGPPGVNGVDGRGISTVRCDGLSLIFTYTDGTSNSVALPGGCIPS